MSLTKEGILEYREINPSKFEAKFGDADVDSLPDGSVFESVAAVLKHLNKPARIAEPKSVRDEKENNNATTIGHVAQAPGQYVGTANDVGQSNSTTTQESTLKNEDDLHVVTQEDLDNNTTLQEQGVVVGDKIKLSDEKVD